jgi:uncharacterized membrane protein
MQFPPIADWISLILRWVHVIAGIAWIGSSFYFVALDAGLKQPERQEPGVGGEAWQVHGGGFYRIQKYLVAPSFLPKQLTWFKWEAYSTWIFGFSLLVITYYAQPELYLIDRQIADLGTANAVIIALLSLPIGWLAYDSLCQSGLGRSPLRLSVGGFVLLSAVIWGFTHIFSGRGAFMQIGALIGSIMVGNVFFVIIPNQEKVVAALLAGRQPDAALGAQSKQRSLPVVFLMISNHYPFLSAGPLSWLVAVGVFVVGFLVRHFFNVGHAGGRPQWWLWPAAAAITLGLAILITPAPADRAAQGSPVAFADVQRIVDARCAVCHAARPSFQGITEPPKGIMLDKPERIAALAPQIYLQAVASHAMPLSNVTGITDDERAALGAWIAAGAKTQ